MASVDRLFSKTFVVRFKSPSSLEDRKGAVNIAVEFHVAQSRRELHLQLTDDDDLFFLHTLTLGEEDFQTLKSQQDLLVDFSAFPQKLIDLLQLCASEEDKPQPKYVLELLSPQRASLTGPALAGGIYAMLKIIETNPFKNLEHLSLKLVAGTDTDVKKHLANKLRHIRDTLSVETTSFERRERDLSDRLRSAEERLSAKSVELEELKFKSQDEKNSATASLQRDLFAEKEKMERLREEFQAKLETERKTSDAEFLRIKNQLEARTTNLEAANRELTDRRYANEASLRELKAKLTTVEDDRARDRAELENSRKSSAALESELRIKEKENAALLHKMARLEEEITDKEKVVERGGDMLAEEREKVLKLEEEALAAATREKKLEKYVKSLSEEVKKGNEIIQRLQTNLKNTDSKLRLRNQIAQEQEKSLKEKTQALEAAKKEGESLVEKMRERAEESELAKKKAEEKGKQLEDAQKQIEKNENLIGWLNKQATEKQLHSIGTRSQITNPLAPTHTILPGMHPLPTFDSPLNVGAHSTPSQSGFTQPAGGAYSSYPPPPVIPSTVVRAAYSLAAPHNQYAATFSKSAYFPGGGSIMPGQSPLPIQSVGVGGSAPSNAGKVESIKNVDAETNGDVINNNVAGGIDFKYLQASKVDAKPNNNAKARSGTNSGGANRPQINQRNVVSVARAPNSLGLVGSAELRAEKSKQTGAPSSYFPKTKLNSVG